MARDFARTAAWVVLVGMGIVVGVSPSSAAITSLFMSGQQTGIDYGSGTFQYLSISSSLSTLGIEFDLAQPVAITRVGGLFRVTGGTTTLFGSVTSMNGSYPNLAELHDVNVGLLTAKATAASVPCYARATRVLEAGHYALVFGTDRFGASGEALTLADSNLITALVPQLPFLVNPGLTSRINQAAPIASGVFGSVLATLSAGVKLLGPEAFGSANVITFETGTTALPTVDRVRFLNHNDSGNFSGVGSFNSAQFGAQMMMNLMSVEDTDLGMEFVTPVTSVGFWINQGDLSPVVSGADVVTFRALDSAGNVVYQTDINTPKHDDSALLDEGLMFVGMSSTTPISRVEWTIDMEGAFGVDNVSYVFVPEPSSAIPAGVAALLALLACWRKRGHSRPWRTSKS